MATLPFPGPARVLDVPAGFHPVSLDEGFIGHNGPFYARREPDGRVTFGFRVLDRHCNPMDNCHGGWLATIADMVLPLSARLTDPHVADRFLLTVQLSIDYLGAAPVGSWIEGGGEMLRRTRRMLFMHCVMRVGAEPVLRASGVFKIAGEAPPLMIG